MSNDEIALQITLKAIDAGILVGKPVNHCETYEEANRFGAEQVADFYEAIYARLKKLT